MALITQVLIPPATEPSDVLMVTDAVGANAANWWTDIQLVQYMIGSIYIYKSAGAGEWNQTMSEAELNALPDPHKDFKALKRTRDLIKRFQDDAVKQGIPVHADGRIDRAYTVKSSITSTPYTILVANYYMQSAVTESQGVENWIGWVVNDDPDLPALVKAQLQV